MKTPNKTTTTFNLSLNDLLNAKNQLIEKIDILIGSISTANGVSHEPKWLLHTHKDGITTVTFASDAEMGAALKKSYDCNLDERNGRFITAENHGNVGDYAQSCRGMCFTSFTHPGKPAFRTDIKEATDTTSDEIFQLPKRLRELVGERLGRRMLGRCKNGCYPVSNDFSFCWVRPPELYNSMLVKNSKAYQQRHNPTFRKAS